MYFAFRMSMVVPKNNMTKSYLKISNVTLEDEALYKCEVTYLAVNRECNNVQHITLNVTGKSLQFFLQQSDIFLIYSF